MDGAQLEAFVAGCVEKLTQKQTALSARGLGNHERFEVDLANGKLRFFDGERLALEANETQTWQLVAMACEHLGALGTYDFQMRSARLYVAIDSIQR
jgi:hypothetical protein